MSSTHRAVVVLSSAWLLYQANAQCPQGQITLASQAEVNAFAANFPSCTALPGSLTINGTDITDLSAFNNLATIGGELSIWGCSSLTSLTGFNALDSVELGVYIWQNDALAIVNGFPDLKVCGNSLFISENPSLTSIGGFGALDSVGTLAFSFNPLLTDIDGYDQAIEIISYLEIVNNPMLSPCNAQAICDHVLDPTNTTVFIQGNAPGCQTREEVIASCINTAVHELPAVGLTVHPNPTTGTLRVQGATDERTLVLIRDDLGRIVLQQALIGRSVDVGSLAPGAYVIEVSVNGRPDRIRFVCE